ncbi:DUF6705 family protein [Chryseobacterium carnipullorum]|uniref:DUF6705 family protein n=1 Tax=Chryseobacterium carnipullorum TaxID=1124835 RepID=UPI000E847399|nr:DUF6705 family protein [Chryseobacterium carnipullorum]HBV13798.1 hypothetical protein [Chryseobacterium carnipullorum]
MKNIFLIALSIITISCKAQTYPLRTFTEIPLNAYLKDKNNELQSYEGIWKGVFNGKTVYITFKKNIYIYDDVLKYYKDNLIAKFKVLDSSSNILFDNTTVSDDKAKIWGGKFRKIDDKYSLIYVDPDLCNTSGNVIINFTDSSKTKLSWKLNLGSNMITTSCQYYDTGIPEALPKEIILTKQ